MNRTGWASDRENENRPNRPGNENKPQKPPRDPGQTGIGQKKRPKSPLLGKKKKQKVVPVGLEPTTVGLLDQCATNCAIKPELRKKELLKVYKGLGGVVFGRKEKKENENFQRWRIGGGVSPGTGLEMVDKGGNLKGMGKIPPHPLPWAKKWQKKSANSVDRTRYLQIFSLTLSHVS